MKKLILTTILFLGIFLLAGCKEEEIIAEETNFSQIYPNAGSYYQIFVRSFADSDDDGIGDFNGITAKLSYLKDLGINAIWLMPIHPSPSYHGYDVMDYYAVNPEYGTMTDFENLLIAAENLDIDIIIDLVINHSSNQNPWFTGWLAGEDEYTGYYRLITSADDRLYQLGSWGQNIWHLTTGGYYCGYFGSSMPDLNWSNPVVQDEMIAMAKYWIEKGVDGFRLDAVLHLEGVGEVLSPTVPIDSTLFKLEWFEYQIELEYPNVYIIGEVFDAFSVSSIFYTAIDATLNFEIGNEILNNINRGYSTDYVTKIIRNNETIKSYDINAYDAPFLKNHDQDRLASILNGNLEKLKLAAEMLLVLPGNPFIYYGEELGMFGIKSTGPFWDETRRLPLPFGDEFTTSWFIDEFNTELPNVSEQSLNENSLLNTYTTLLNLRNNSLALKYGDIFAYEETSYVLQGFYRIFNYDDSHQEIVLVLHNLGDVSYQFSLENENILYYSDGIDNYDGNINEKSTLILTMPKEMIGNFYE